MLYAGIDIGSTGLKRAILDNTGKIIKIYPYIRHLGNIETEVEKGLEEINQAFGNVHLTFTGKVGENIAVKNALDHENEVLCVLSSLKEILPEIGTIIDIGGQDSKVIPIVNDNKIITIGSGVRMNSSCAGGTGSFMDQQAERLYGAEADKLGIVNSSERIDFVLQKFIEGARNSTNPVRIAGRCSVFAKSDMIHNQQAG